MAKDPAVLFYTSDFLASTLLWSDAEIGAYIKLLCLQHLQGGLEEADLLTITQDYPRVRSKFLKEEDELYYNPRMKAESEKRKKFTESRRANGYKKYSKKASAETVDDASASAYADASAEHMGNGNINRNINGNIDVIEEIEESEEKKRKEKVREIITYLNSKLGTRYTFTAEYINKHIRARLAEGFTVEDFCIVIDKKHREWIGTEMAKFLRPETLFGTKFMTYLNQPDVPYKPQTAIGANGVEYYVGASDLDDIIPG